MQLLSRPFRATAALVASVVLFGASARADFVALTVTPDPFNTINDHVGYSLGYEFKMNSTETVTQLGYFDDGLMTQSHAVGIYTTAGTLLASTTVTTADALTANFRYHAIAPLTLSAGQTYVIAGVSGVLDPYAFNPTALSTDPSVTFISGDYRQSFTLEFPTTIDHFVGYFGPNFIVRSAVPEPSTVCLLGIGATSSLVGAWRRRTGRKARD